MACFFHLWNIHTLCVVSQIMKLSDVGLPTTPDGATLGGTSEGSTLTKL